jgi:ABC-type phosphate transport system substrate-binding protein
MKVIFQIVLYSGLLFSTNCLADVAVIVNVDNKSSVSDSDISRLFLGKLKKFNSGSKAVAINLKLGNETRNEFESKVLKKSPSQIKAYWSKRVFSGKGKPPPELVSDKDILTMVYSDSNIIAYIDAANVDETVRVIKVF